MDITFYLFFMALLVSFAAWCVFLWAIRTGQFQDLEQVKYQVWPPQPSLPADPQPGRSEASREHAQPTE